MIGKRTKKKNRSFFFVLFIMPALFIGTLLADTTEIKNSNDTGNSNDVSVFTVDNSDSGVKNNRPVDLSVNQDSLLGFIGDAKILLRFDNTNAAAVELAAGPKVFRGNGTYGFAFNDKNRIKVTAEYLTEDLDFDFYNGETRQWVSQGAIGVAYQYWLDGSTFKSLQVGSHYSHARNKDLKDKTIDLGQGVTLLDERYIAGGDDWNATAETAMRLWSHSLVTMGADYDQVRYDTRYDIHNNANAQGMGGHILLQQLLDSNTQLQLQTGVSQLANNYGGGLNWIWTSRDHTALAVGFNSVYTEDHTTDRRFWVNGIHLNVVWNAPHSKETIARYSDPDISAADLLTWTSTPAVRMPDVLAISDERISHNALSGFKSISATCPGQDDVSYNVLTGTYSAPGGWTQTYPAAGVFAGPEKPAFDSANIMTPNKGVAQCLYGVIDTQESNLILSNASYQLVQPEGNNWGTLVSPFWPLPQQPASACISVSANATDCHFATVDPTTTAMNVVKSRDYSVIGNSANQEEISSLRNKFQGYRSVVG